MNDRKIMSNRGNDQEHKRGNEQEHEESWGQDSIRDEDEDERDYYNSQHQITETLSEIERQQEFISKSIPSTQLEIAQSEEIRRKLAQIDRLTREVEKLKNFISKRKQTYKRKRKEEGAPTRALSAYNIFVQDRFSKLAKDNEEALKSADANAQLKRVPPASLVASTGNEWRELPAEEKAKYEEKAREDRRRYESQMAQYQPPEKQRNKKRNKTGYNMFFSAHVLQLKSSESGVPSERGSVARLVGNAWKDLSAEEKQYYDREAEKQNAMDTESLGDEEDTKRPASDAARFSPVAARGSVMTRHDVSVHRQLAPPPQMMHQLVHSQGHRGQGHMNHGHYGQSSQYQHGQGYQYQGHHLHPGHPSAMSEPSHPSQGHHHPPHHSGRSPSQHPQHMPPHHHHSGV